MKIKPPKKQQFTPKELLRFGSVARGWFGNNYLATDGCACFLLDEYHVENAHILTGLDKQLHSIRSYSSPVFGEISESNIARLAQPALSPDLCPIDQLRFGWQSFVAGNDRIIPLTFFATSSGDTIVAINLGYFKTVALLWPAMSAFIDPDQMTFGSQRYLGKVYFFDSQKTLRAFIMPVKFDFAEKISRGIHAGIFEAKPWGGRNGD